MNLPIRIKLQYQVRVLQVVWKRYHNNPTLLNKVWVEQEQRNLGDLIVMYVKDLYPMDIEKRKTLISKLSSKWCNLMVSNFQ
jgi:hypothetical protein